MAVTDDMTVSPPYLNDTDDLAVLPCPAGLLLVQILKPEETRWQGEKKLRNISGRHDSEQKPGTSRPKSAQYYTTTEQPL